MAAGSGDDDPCPGGICGVPVPQGDRYTTGSAGTQQVAEAVRGFVDLERRVTEADRTMATPATPTTTARPAAAPAASGSAFDVVGLVKGLAGAATEFFRIDREASVERARAKAGLSALDAAARVRAASFVTTAGPSFDGGALARVAVPVVGGLVLLNVVSSMLKRRR